MSHRMRCVAATATLGLAALGSFPGASPHATSVAATNPGPGAFFPPSNALGPPVGEGLSQGSLDVYSTGSGGSITVELDVPALDGPGADLIVSENPFLVAPGASTWVEAAFVEVSTTGAVFVRFPTRYAGPPGPFAPFTGAAPGWYRGFAGVLPVTTNPANGIDPLDVVAANGDAFDLADLADHPDVVSGAVDLDLIRFVRLVDVEAGVDQDELGTTVWDATTGGTDTCDIDALTAVNHLCNQGGGRPAVEMDLSPLGTLTISISDPDGLNDVKFGLAASVDAIDLNFFTLAQLFVTTELTSTSWTLQTGPVPEGTFAAILKVGAVDGAGLTSGDQLVIQ